MTFNESTDKWFCELIDCEADTLLPLVKRYPTKRNLLALCDNVRALAIEEKLDAGYEILDTIAGILTGKFDSEFRHRYHSYPKFAGRVSACGSLFSMIRQAIDAGAENRWRDAWRDYELNPPGPLANLVGG